MNEEFFLSFFLFENILWRGAGMKGSTCKHREAPLCGDVNAGRDEMECARTHTHKQVCAQ